MNINVATATQAHIDSMMGRFREEDEKECKALGGVCADEGARLSFHRSELCWVGFVDGDPFVCFGVSRVSFLNPLGIVWLLGTDSIKKVRLCFLRKSRCFIKEMLKNFDSLENYVHIENAVSIKWLSWCGFVLDKSTPYVFNHEKFYRFRMEKERVKLCA